MINKQKLRSVNVKGFVFFFLAISVFYMMLGVYIVQYRIAEMEEQLEIQSNQIGTSLAYSLASGEYGYTYIENLMGNKLRVAAQSVFLHEETLTDQTLNEYKEIFNVDRIIVFEGENDVLFATVEDADEWRIPADHELHSFIESGDAAFVSGVRESSVDGEAYKFGYHRTDEGLISQVAVKAERIEQYSKAYEMPQIVDEIDDLDLVDSIVFIDEQHDVTYTSSDSDMVTYIETLIQEDEMLLDWSGSEKLIHAEDDVIGFYPVEHEESGLMGSIAVVQSKDRLSEVVQSMVTIGTVVYLSFFLIFSFVYYRLFRKTKNHFSLAYYDSLTGLPNQSYFRAFMDRLRERQDQSENHNESQSIYMLNISNFRSYNLSEGYQKGDEVLSQLGAFLNHYQPDSHLAFRLNSDRFVIVHWNKESDTMLEEDAASLCHALSERVNAEGIQINIAVLKRWTKETDYEDIYRKLDLTLDKIQSNPEKRMMVFDETLESEYQRKETLKRELKDAIAGTGRSSLYYHYQPKVDLRSGAVLGVELLSRFYSEAYGPVRPDEFIELAEKEQLIHELGFCILRESEAFARQIRAELGRDLCISVNLSPLQLYKDGFADAVLDVFSEQGNHAMIEFEVTESVFTDTQDERVMTHLNRLRNHGFRISMDDFGKGYSSFSSLHELPIDQLKIDRLFIRDVNESNKEKSLMQDIISMGHRLGLEIVAEGIETRFQADYLRALHCDTGQGYYFSKPLEKKDILVFLSDGDLS